MKIVYEATRNRVYGPYFVARIPVAYQTPSYCEWLIPNLVNPYALHQ